MMKSLFAIAMIAVLGAIAPGGSPEQPAPERSPASPKLEQQRAGLAPEAIEYVAIVPTFATIDITIDPLGQPLAAYQFDLTSDDASFTVVGVEGGEHDAFDHGRPPYFDPVVKQGQTDRLILAEYAKPALDAAQLPTDALRVATVHVMFAGAVDDGEAPTLQLMITAAGNADGKPIEAQISYTFRTPAHGNAQERPQ